MSLLLKWCLCRDVPCLLLGLGPHGWDGGKVGPPLMLYARLHVQGPAEPDQAIHAGGVDQGGDNSEAAVMPAVKQLPCKHMGWHASCQPHMQAQKSPWPHVTLPTCHAICAAAGCGAQLAAGPL